MAEIHSDESDIDGEVVASDQSVDAKLAGLQVFDIEPGEIALCDYSKPPDIHCRRVKTIGEVSDGYHTFDELYAHRVELWIQLCRFLDIEQHFQKRRPGIGPWRSLNHSDGSCFEGWFVLGLFKSAGKQMTYHVPISRWKDCGFAETLDRAPEFDGHTSADVLERLKRL